MADSWIVGRSGQINQAGDVNALFLKLFSGEVLTTYQTECIMDPLVRSMTISGGKSYQFPVTGRVSAGFHTPGQEIVGTLTNQNEIIIPVDDLLIADVAIPNIDEAKQQYDYRSIYSIECGRALARSKDNRLIRTALLAARAANAAPIVEQNDLGGKSHVLTNANMSTDKTVLRQNLKLAAQILDENNVPSNDRVAIMPPVLHYLMLEDDQVINHFYDTGGSVRQGVVHEIYGLSLKKTNNMPTTVYGTLAGENNTYSGDFTKTKASVFQKDAIATVNLLSLSTEMEYAVRFQATLVVSKFSCGHGVLRAVNAIELATP